MIWPAQWSADAAVAPDASFGDATSGPLTIGEQGCAWGHRCGGQRALLIIWTPLVPCTLQVLHLFVNLVDVFGDVLDGLVLLLILDHIWVAQGKRAKVAP